MTDERVINALKKYIECAEGTQIARDVGGTLVISLLQNALDLINRQQAQLEYLQGEREVLLEDIKASSNQVIEQQTEIEKLNVELVGMRGACNSYKMHYDNAKAEIERLKEELEIRNQKRASIFEISNAYERGRAKAIKELEAKIHEKLHEAEMHGNFEPVVTREMFDSVVKELVGEGK